LIPFCCYRELSFEVCAQEVSSLVFFTVFGDLAAPGLYFILVALRLWVDFLRGPFSAREQSSSGQLLLS
jgi:hypothetical protein